MTSPSVARVIAGATLVLGAFAPAVASSSAILAWPAAVPTDPKQLEARTDSLRLAGKVDAALAEAAAFETAAQARGDSSWVLQGRLIEGKLYLYAARHARAESVFRKALPQARALGDSARARDALLQLGVALEGQGHVQEAVDCYSQLEELGRQAHALNAVAWARMYLGRVANAQGRFKDARKDLEFARDVFDSLGITRDQLNATNLLGITRFSLLDLEGSADCFRECVELARQVNNPSIQGRGLNNLANVEFALGDPALATRHFEDALELARHTGSTPSLVLAALNVGESRARLGRYADAVAILEEAQQIAQEHGLQQYVCNSYQNLALAHELAGKLAAAKTAYRESIAMARAAALPQDELVGVLGLSRILAHQDSVQAAYDLVDARAEALRAVSTPAWGLQLDQQLGAFLVGLGRHAEALQRNLAVERLAQSAGMVNFHVQTLGFISDSYRAMGSPDSALAVLQRGARIWESQRSLPTDAQWREQRGAAGRDIYERTAALLLDEPASASPDDRARSAFDALQRFKARTLLERVRGPGVAVGGAADSAAIAGAGVHALQSGVLERGELLLDVYCGEKETFVFAVTPQTCRAARLVEQQDHLQEKLDVLQGLLVPSGQSVRMEGAADEACRTLGALLLSPFEDLLQQCNRVLFSGDGNLNLLALSALQRGAAPAGTPLVAEKEIVYVPSTALLARARQAVLLRATRPRVRSMLALAGEGDGPVSLPAARQEVEQLGRAYRGVEVLTGDDARQTALKPTRLAHYDLLHFAAHASVSDESPWRSAILFSSAGPIPNASVRRGQADDRASQERALRASTIAGLELNARMVVLSACSSAGGRVLSGEGVVGLTSAFLSAGVPTVVATLWQVDDRATSQLMRRFYQELAKGATAAAALRRAQMAVRTTGATRDPFFWAGFVLVGEGDTRIALARRHSSWVSLVGGLIVIAAAVEAMRRRRVRRKA